MPGRVDLITMTAIDRHSDQGYQDHGHWKTKETAQSDFLCEFHLALPKDENRDADNWKLD